VKIDSKKQDHIYLKGNMMAKQKTQYTNQQLYDGSGEPQLVDIRQDDLYNCYLVSSMGALAQQQPDRVRDAIRYEPDPNDPSTGVFHVALHHPTRGLVEVPVTQADVEYNIQRDGGGTADNKKGSPLWPTVMEAAFTKLHDPNPNNLDRKEGYDVIADPRRGGNLHEAMFALTGDKGHNLRYDQSPTGHSGPPGSASIKDEGRPSFNVKLYEKDVTRFDDANSAYTKINEALGSGNPVTLSTRNANVNDGIMKHHAYIVTDIEQREKKDGTLETFVTMRNPYARNDRDPTETGTSKPSITVSLDKMLKDDVFGEFNIGPASRVQRQKQDMPAPVITPEQITPTPNKNDHLQSTPSIGPPTTSRSPDDKDVIGVTTGLQLGNDFREKGHPGNAAYEKMLYEVRRMETTNGIAHGPNSELVAAALLVKAEQTKFDTAAIVRMEPDGMVSTLKLSLNEPIPKLSVDPKDVVAQGQSFEKSTQLWAQARSPHYASDAPAAERTQEQVKALAQMTPDDRGIFDKIRENVPPHIGDDVVAKAMLETKQGFVSNADTIDKVEMKGELLLVQGKTSGSRSATDVSEPAPAITETVKQTESFNQQLAIDLRLQQEQALAKKLEQENQGAIQKIGGGAAT
jgi:hypothetical protein